jgi:hypothetical protein
MHDDFKRRTQKQKRQKLYFTKHVIVPRSIVEVGVCNVQCVLIK